MQNAILDVAVKAARTAGERILAELDHVDQATVTGKNSNEFVTHVDRLSEEMIVDQLQEAYPDFGILAEEGGHISGVSHNTHLWIVDPLDGTRNFMQGYSPFSISIALMIEK